MPSKYYLRNFHQDGYYHLYNRGANKLNIFKNDNDYRTFLSIMKYYLLSPTGIPLSTLHYPRPPNSKVRNLIKVPNPQSSFDLLAYCLMPNHFHFLIHQKHMPSSNTSVINFMRRLFVTYAMYAKDKYDRSGALLQGRYKSVKVDSNTQLLHLSRYIYLNPTKILDQNQKLSDYSYSSYPDYLGKHSPSWLNPQKILDQFANSPFQKYFEFVENQITDSSLLKNLTLE